MERQAPPEVAEIVGRFFAARRAGRRASVDEVLEPVEDASEHARLRTVVLREIARETRSAATRPGSSAAQGDLTAAAPTAAEFPELEGYDLIDLIGRGGMGVVYEAYQQATGRRVAVKFMLAAEQTEVGRRRFEREIELIARLQHPNVVSVLDAGIDRGRYYYVMEYVDGRPLNAVLPPGKCGPRQVLAALATVAEAVDYAHQRGVLHRDLKPSNVLVDERGSVYLLDFGLAKAIEPGAGAGGDLTISHPGQLVGTLAYMSPEQSRGDLEHISVRSDVYSLGAMAYELLTGALPCSIDGPLAEVLARIGQCDPLKPSSRRRELDADVDAILLEALEKTPHTRYATAAEMAADIRRHLANEPIRARPSGPGRRLVRWVRRRRGVAAVSAVAILAVLIVTTTWLAQVGAERARAARVQQFFTRNFGFATPDVAKRATIERRDLYDYAAIRVADELAAYPIEQAAVRQALGSSYLELSLYPEARAQLSQALEIRRRELGSDHPDTAETLHTLALVQQQLNEYDAARQNYEQALEVRRRAFGPRSAPVAETLNNLGWLAKERGDYAEAETRYSAALDLRRGLFGPSHPAAAETLNDLAHLHYVTGQYTRAEELFREALAIRLRLHPDRQNTSLAATMASLGSVLNKLGRYDEAGALLAEALAIRERVCGPRHGDTLVSRNEWGLHLLETGQYAAAQQVLRENVRLREDVHGPRHRFVAVSLANLGLVLDAEGSFAEAEQLYRRALDIFVQLYGGEKDHCDLAAVWRHLASVLCDLARNDEALEYAQGALDMRLRLAREARGAEVGQAYCTLGSVRLARGELAEARELLEKGVALLTGEVPVSHWRAALARSELGDCLTRLGEFEQAEPLLTEAYDHIRIAQGAQSRYADSAAQRVIRLYEAWGRPDDAGRYRALTPSPQE